MKKQLKTTIYLLFGAMPLYFSTGCAEATVKTPDAPVAEQTTGYDSVLAKQLGADDYGMQRYVMAFLKRGTFGVRQIPKASESAREVS